jgi:polyisoprenoid-binding protein YceI
MSIEHWDFDNSHSSVNFHVRHLMISKVHGAFKDWKGTFAFDRDQPSNSRIEVTIQANSLDTKDDKRDAHLRSPDFFDVEKFPTLTFASSKVTKTGDETFELVGDLTLHGVTKQVTLVVEGGAIAKDPWGGTRTGFSAKTSINRKDFGLVWNVALETGGILVGDKVDITLEIEAIKKA